MKKPTGGQAFPGDYIDTELRDALVAAHKAGAPISMSAINALVKTAPGPA